ncbi:hypothetical protein V9T40_011357 [Parthenolecanium corni]|uniref:Uncharacterized protein n=1 Tax=Parthenolecanium corni TaxID=536013 RepID=A0AAN9XY34_9HEMI
MCAKVNHLPDKEELFEKQIQLEGENKRLWDEIKEKNVRIVSLTDKLLLQENLLKSQTELKTLLHEYLETIRSLQKNIGFLQNENKILEKKFIKSQLGAKQPPNAGDSGSAAQKKLQRENFVLRMKLYSLEKEMRRCMLVWDKNVNISTDVVAARETIMSLEQKLLQCQPAVTECKQLKAQLVEAEEKFKTCSFMNVVLKDELEKTKVQARQAVDKQDELKKQTTKYGDMIAKLKEENTSMERFVEKSFRLEGALAELDDLNVVLKKQETMLGVLFDENQALKDGIGHLFDDMNALKDRNWKLERYANDMEDSFYKAEKNANTLEQRLDYYQALQVDNEKLKFHNAEMNKSTKFLENANNSLTEKLAAAEKKVQTTAHALNLLKEEKQKLIKELNTIRADYSNNNAKLARENEYWVTECEKQKALLSGYARLPADFKALQKKLSESQDTVYKFKEEMRRLKDENQYLKQDLGNFEYKANALKADRDRYQLELKEAELKIKQLEYQLESRNQKPMFNRY